MVGHGTLQSVKRLTVFWRSTGSSVGEPLHTECLFVVVNVSLNTFAVFYSKLFDGM